MEEMRESLSERKKQILKAVIDAHISCGEPVGSKALSQDKHISLSPATIRNELAELTEMGYLAQPHTSAGRVPTEQGYRFYVDTLMQAYDMTASEIRGLNEMLMERTARLDKIIDSAGRLVSTLTHYPAIAVRSFPKKQTAKCINLMKIADNELLVIVMISESNIKTKHLNSELALTDEALRKMQNSLNATVVGKQAEELTLAQILALEENFGSYRSLASPIIKSVFETLDESGSDELQISGVDRFLEYPEFTEVDKLKDMLGMLSDKQDLLTLVRKSEGSDVNIYIGSENTADKSGESTLVVKTIRVGGKPVGAIGVIGPCRMDYSKVVSTMETLSNSISDMIAAGRPALPDAGKRELPDGIGNKNVKEDE